MLYLDKHFTVKSTHSFSSKYVLFSGSRQQLHTPPIANSTIFSSFSSANTSAAEETTGIFKAYSSLLLT